MRYALVPALVLLLAACAVFDTPADYNRHRLSDITLPREGVPAGDRDLFFFDVTVNAEFPADGQAAEAARMRWLSEWLEQRHMCPSGHEVLRRREFDFMEDNPARRDLRYEVRCRS